MQTDTVPTATTSDPIGAPPAIVDLDSHMHPTLEMERYMRGGADRPQFTRSPRRHFDVAPEMGWTLKGPRVFGSDDPGERLQVLDLLNIERQLVLPFQIPPGIYDYGNGGLEYLRRHNDCIIDWCSSDRTRLLATAMVGCPTVEWAVDEAERVLALGARAILLPCVRPPAGLSPAAPEWDRLWATMADHGAAVVFHIGTGGSSGPNELPNFVDPMWAATLGLRGAPDSGPDYGERFGPFRAMTVHFPVECYLTAMVLGGVFERHPALRVVVAEMTAGWVKSWVDRLDETADAQHPTVSQVLSHRPSTYVRAAIRVVPFPVEPIGAYLAAGGPSEVYAFGTDFPHIEGGIASYQFYSESLAPHGEDALRCFYHDNAATVFPA
jgi:predicted TIM-barrel fold metal-dependent hydrolase